MSLNCSVSFCELSAKKKGLCMRHYKQMRRCGKILLRTIRDPNEIIIEGELCRMKLYNIKGDVVGITLIDKDDLDKVKGIKWCLSGGYIIRGGGKKALSLHRHILGADEHGTDIDHINHYGLDNRKINLRLATRSQNNQNQKLRNCNTSGYKGVSWDKERKKWQCRIGLNEKTIHLGRFKDKIVAAITYNEAAEKYFGEFARKNEVILSL